MTNEILNDAIYIIMALAVVIVTRYLVPYLNSKLAAAKQDTLAKLIENLVQAAEQLFTGEKMGEQKKSYVVNALAKDGVEITESVNAMIESAVYSLAKNG